MKPHPRIRKTLKWSGAAITLLLLATWLASGHWSYRSTDAVHPWFSFAGGRFNFGVEGPDIDDFYVPPIDGWMAWPRYRIAWSMDWDFSWGWFIAIPLWPVILATTAITLTAWRLDTLAARRARAHLCLKCRYDRRGLPPNAVCPECGTLAIASTTTMT